MNSTSLSSRRPARLGATAIVPKSGDATPAKGDIEGFAHGVPTGAQGVTISLDSVRQ